MPRLTTATQVMRGLMILDAILRGRRRCSLSLSMNGWHQGLLVMMRPNLRSTLCTPYMRDSRCQHRSSEPFRSWSLLLFPVSAIVAYVQCTQCVVNPPTVHFVTHPHTHEHRLTVCVGVERFLVDQAGVGVQQELEKLQALHSKDSRYQV